MELKERCIALVGVLRDARPFWTLLIGLGLAAIVGWLLAEWLSASPADVPADAVRYAGAALQLFGLGLVARGLSEARVLFGRPPLMASIRAWFVRLASVFRARHAASLQADLRASGRASGNLSTRKIPGPGSTLEQRLEALERNVRELENETRRDLAALRDQIGQIGTAVHHEATERTRSDRVIEQRMEKFAVGGLHLEAVGLIWLLFGTVAGSAPDETAAFIAAVFRAF